MDRSEHEIAAPRGSPAEPGVGPGAESDLCVGREGELASLCASLDAARAHGTRLRMLVGDAGIGKTRIAQELARMAAERGVTVAWGRCHEDAGAPPHWPWTQVLRELGIELPVDGAGAAVRAVAGPSSSDRVFLRADEAEQLRFRFFDRVSTALALAAERRPLVIVLDDLHWADRASLLLLRFIARERAASPLLVVGAYRSPEAAAHPDVLALLEEIARFSEPIELAGLDAEAVATLAAARLGDAPPAEVVRELCERTGGNPFFVHEIVRLGLGGDGLPAGVRVVLRRRLSLLRATTRRALAFAAVAGEDFELAVVARAAGPRAAAPLGGEALAAGIIAPGRRLGRFRFAHALLREVVYRDLPAAERARLHERIGEAIEGVHAGAIEEHLSALARHFTAAVAPSGSSERRGRGDAPSPPRRALEYAVRAGERATALVAYEEGARLYAQALDLAELAHEPAVRRCDLENACGDALRRAGDKTAARDCFRRAAALARGIGAWDRIARAALGFAGPWVRLVSLEDAEVSTLLEEAIARLPDQETALRARLIARLAMELSAGDVASRRDELAAAAIKLARSSADAATLAYALSVQHLLAFGPGDLRRRFATTREILRLARKSRDEALEADAQGMIVLDLLEAGRIDEMDAALDAHARIAERIRQPAALFQVALRRGMQALLEGRLGEAEHLAGRAARIGERGQIAYRVPIGLQMFQIRREQGRLPEMSDQLDLVIHAAREHPLAPYLRLYFQAATGQHELARAGLDAVAADDFRDPPGGMIGLVALCLAAEACATLDARPYAEILYRRLMPFADRAVVLGNGVAYLDTTSRLLGLLAHTMRRGADACGHLDAAVAVYDRLGAEARLAHTLHDLARVQRSLGAEQAAEDGTARALRIAQRLGIPDLRADADARREGHVRSTMERRATPAALSGEYVFRRQGEYWDLVFDGAASRLRDCKGLHQIAYLLQSPGRAHLVVDLVAPAERGIVEVRTRDAAQLGRTDEHALRVGDLGDAGEVLDARSAAAYRTRWRELIGERDEARDLNDVARLERIQEEIDALEAQLASGIGLRGGARRAGSHVERARVSVTRTIRDAIRRISRHDAVLGHFLTSTVRTGRLCSYEPPPGAVIEWRI